MSARPTQHLNPEKNQRIALVMLCAGLALLIAGWVIPAVSKPGQLSKERYQHGQQLRNNVSKLLHSQSGLAKKPAAQAEAAKQLADSTQALKNHLHYVESLKTRGKIASRICMTLGFCFTIGGVLLRQTAAA